MKRRLRMIFKLLLFLLAGAIMNVAVAWGCALWSGQSLIDPGNSGTWSIYDTVPENSSYSAFGITICCRRQTENIPSSTEFASANHRIYRPGWNWVWEKPSRIELGVPLRSFWHSATSQLVASYGQADLTLWTVGISCGCVISKNFQVSRSLPLIPIWPGFAINTIFYAAVLWVLFAIPGAVRRLRGGVRIKRGQCVACGYSLRENVSDKCPECGALTGNGVTQCAVTGLF